MAKEVAVKKMGRPSAITEGVVSKLVEVFKLGVTDDLACSTAQISRETFYKHIKENPDFADKIMWAKNYGRIKAGAVVVTAIENDDKETAKWWLEKKHADEFGGAKVTQATQINIELPSWAKDEI